MPVGPERRLSSADYSAEPKLEVCVCQTPSLTVELPEPLRFIPLKPRRKNRVRQSPRIWYTKEEYALVDESARLCGKVTSAFIREASFGIRFSARRFLANAELIRELGKSAMALSRLAAIARETGALRMADGLEMALKELVELVNQIEPSRLPRAR